MKEHQKQWKIWKEDKHRKQWKKSKDENAKKTNDESEEEKITKRQEKKKKKKNMKKRTEDNVEESETKRRRLLHSDGPVDDPSNNVLDDNTADHKSKKVKKMKWKHSTKFTKVKRSKKTKANIDDEIEETLEEESNSFEDFKQPQGTKKRKKDEDDDYAKEDKDDDIKQDVDTSSEFDEQKYLETKKKRMKYSKPKVKTRSKMWQDRANTLKGHINVVHKGKHYICTN